MRSDLVQVDRVPDFILMWKTPAPVISRQQKRKVLNLLLLMQQVCCI